MSEGNARGWSVGTVLVARRTVLCIAWLENVLCVAWRGCEDIVVSHGECAKVMRGALSTRGLEGLQLSWLCVELCNIAAAQWPHAMRGQPCTSGAACVRGALHTSSKPAAPHIMCPRGIARRGVRRAPNHLSRRASAAALAVVARR